ncbi:MAG: hypothetical protein ACI9Y1_001622, partial [Lentisphaeria bacterium]
FEQVSMGFLRKTIEHELKVCRKCAKFCVFMIVIGLM